MTVMTRISIGLAIVLAASPGATLAGQSPERSVPAATVVMQFPEALGGMQRAAVEFDHALHASALEQEGCDACHPIEQGLLTPQLATTIGLENRDRLIDAYHYNCVGCHEDRAAASRKAGPVTCGECHVRRAPAVSGRAPMAFDYSLHARHAAAYEDKCENCHHVYDEATEQLRYEKGKEEGCASCHGAEDEQRKLSRANASHRSCVSCHLARIDDRLEGGPVRCAGCHDAERRSEIEVLDPVPRLVRGQPDTAWIATAEAKTAVVAFDHELHEGRTNSCSACHHRTLRPCDDCHTLLGSADGAGVTVAQAYHREPADHSCVGCHAAQSRQQSCVGCHAQLYLTPTESSCAVCHSGPLAGPQVAEIPAPTLVAVELAVLPPVSESYPETVEISSLVDRYEASRLPHAKIVARLDAGVRESGLASRFHREVDTLCAGCHHHSPVGTRPPPCRSCHAEAATTRDMPGLKTAYHRQCVGCHLEMGIPQQGCSDCHAEREELQS